MPNEIVTRDNGGRERERERERKGSESQTAHHRAVLERVGSGYFGQEHKKAFNLSTDPDSCTYKFYSTPVPYPGYRTTGSRSLVFPFTLIPTKTHSPQAPPGGSLWQIYLSCSTPRVCAPPPTGTAWTLSPSHPLGSLDAIELIRSHSVCQNRSPYRCVCKTAIGQLGLGFAYWASSPPPANQPRPLSTAMASWHRGTHAFRLVITFRNRLRLPSRNRMMHYGCLKGVCVCVHAVLALGTVQAPSNTGSKCEEGVKHTILSHRKVYCPRPCIECVWILFEVYDSVRILPLNLHRKHCEVCTTHTHTHCHHQHQEQVNKARRIRHQQGVAQSNRLKSA